MEIKIRPNLRRINISLCDKNLQTFYDKAKVREKEIRSIKEDHKLFKSMSSFENLKLRKAGKSK